MVFVGKKKRFNIVINGFIGFLFIKNKRVSTLFQNISIMSRTKLKFYLSLSVVLITGFFSEQVVKSQETSNNWDLEQCISYAKEHNIELKQQRLTTGTAEADLLASRGQRLPSLSGTVKQTGDNAHSINDLGEDTGWSFNYGGSLGLSAGVTLYSGGIINNNIKQDKLAVEAAFLSVEQAEMDITLSVTQAYLNILYAHENMKYYKEVVETSKLQVERAKIMRGAGSISRKDLVDLEAQLASDEYSLVTAQNNLVTLSTTLKQLLDIPVEDSFEIAYSEEEINVLMDELPERSKVYELVLQNRPDVRYSMLQYDMAGLDLKNAKAGYLPTLSLSATAGSSYSNGYDTSYRSQLSDNFNQGIGLTLSIPIFSQFSNKASVKRSQISLETASLSVTDTRNKLLQTVEQVYEDSNGNRQRYMAAISQEAATAESYRLSEEQFNLGMLNSVELMQTKTTHLNARSELIQSKYATLLYRKILDYYMGIPIEL